MRGSRHERLVAAIVLVSAAGLSAGCQGTLSDDPPIHLIQNMDDQQRYDAQEDSALFPNAMAMRPRIEGTVPATAQLEDDPMVSGRTPEGDFLAALPESLVLDEAFLRRGQTGYAVNCAPCHDLAGDGKGPAVARGMLPPPSLHDARLRSLPVGQIHDVIRNGIRNMPAYRHVPPRDRWAIAAYVRALQVSRAADRASVPAEIRAREGWDQ